MRLLLIAHLFKLRYVRGLLGPHLFKLADCSVLLDSHLFKSFDALVGPVKLLPHHVVVRLDARCDAAFAHDLDVQRSQALKLNELILHVAMLHRGKRRAIIDEIDCTGAHGRLFDGCGSAHTDDLTTLTGR